MGNKKIDVMATARLARLEFNDDECQRLEREMAQFDAFADCLRSFDMQRSESEEKTCSLCFRDDDAESYPHCDELVSLSSGARDGYICVPVTVDKEGGK